MAAAGVLIFYLYCCCIEIIGVLIYLCRVRRGVSGDNFVAHACWCFALCEINVFSVT